MWSIIGCLLPCWAVLAVADSFERDLRARKSVSDAAKQALEKRAWVNRYAGPEGCAAGLKRQYAQMRRGLAELGLAKD